MKKTLLFLAVAVMAMGAQAQKFVQTHEIKPFEGEVTLKTQGVKTLGTKSFNAIKPKAATTESPSVSYYRPDGALYVYDNNTKADGIVLGYNGSEYTGVFYAAIDTAQSSTFYYTTLVDGSLAEQTYTLAAGADSSVTVTLANGDQAPAPVLIGTSKVGDNDLKATTENDTCQLATYVYGGVKGDGMEFSNFNQYDLQYYGTGIRNYLVVNGECNSSAFGVDTMSCSSLGELFYLSGAKVIVKGGYAILWSVDTVTIKADQLQMVFYTFGSNGLEKIATMPCTYCDSMAAGNPDYGYMLAEFSGAEAAATRGLSTKTVGVDDGNLLVTDNGYLFAMIEPVDETTPAYSIVSALVGDTNETGYGYSVITYTVGENTTTRLYSTNFLNYGDYGTCNYVVLNVSNDADEIAEAEEAVTGIQQAPVVDSQKAGIYDLSGRRLSEIQKGLNIVNGKKVIK